jgi:hypothetical protein
MTNRWNKPSGQAVIETVVVLGVMATLLAGLMIIAYVGDSGLKNSQATRIASFDCDVRPGHCRSGSQASQSRTQMFVFGRADSEVQSVPAGSTNTLKPPEFQSLGRNRRAMESTDALRLAVDTPRVDGAEQSLLMKLSDAFRNFTMKAGPSLFGLPSPDQLTRSTVSLDLWGSRNADNSSSGKFLAPSVRLQSRLAMISDSWAAADRQQFHRRVRDGESPLKALDMGVSALYLPGKDALMPVMDAIGLEADTRPFRQAFQNVSHDTPYGNSRVSVR